MSTLRPVAIALLVVDAFDVGAYWRTSSLSIEARGDGPADRTILDDDVNQLKGTVPSAARSQ